MDAASPPPPQGTEQEKMRSWLSKLRWLKRKKKKKRVGATASEASPGEETRKVRGFNPSSPPPALCLAVPVT